MMKITLKKTLVAAAIAALAMSGAAEARIQDAAGSAGSELVFSAWDATAGVGYTLDLGWASTLNSLIGADTNYATAVNGTLAMALPANGILFDQALTNFTFANLNNVQWNLAAADNIGRNRMLLTQGDSAANMITSNNNVKNAVTAFSANYVSPVNSKGTHVGADVNVDGYANTTALADGTAFAGAASFGNTINGRVNDTSSLLGASANLWVLGMNSSTTTGSAGSNPGYLAQLMTASGQNIIAKTYLAEDGYHLQIAAVPEPESYAMFLAGLGLMGFIARRRTQA